MAYPKIYSKYYSYKILEQADSLKPYLLPTDYFSLELFKKWLKQFRSIYIKPEYNNGGKGIFRVLAKDNQQYEISSEKRTIQTDMDQLLNKIQDEMNASDKYVMQKGIDLISLNGSIVDFRVFSQKINGKWICPGMVGKLASPGKMITNLHGGGRAVPVPEVLQSLHVDKNKQRTIITDLEKIANDCGQICHRFYPNLKEVALDIGLSKDLKLFVIEVNTHFPGTVLFQQLEDRTMFRRIWANRRKMGEWRNFPQFKKKNLNQLK